MKSKSIPWPVMQRDLVAILRGVKPEEVVGIANELVEAGIQAIEVPLNSPRPFESIELLAANMPAHILVGAGTVVDEDDVDRLHAAGGKLLVSPNVNEDVIQRASDLNMVTLPGVFTPTEAFKAVRAGASALKFFPASVLGPQGIAAIKTVLPAGTRIGVVGGVDHHSFQEYASVGVSTFGLGSNLYRPGYSAEDVSKLAKEIVRAYDAAF